VNRNAFKILGRRPEETKPFGILKCRWRANIKMDIKEVEW
jgi:hypothetical protein